MTDAALIGSTLYLLTHRNAPHFKVLRVDLANPDLASAPVVVPESAAVITGIAAGKDALYVRRMSAGVSDLLPPRARVARARHAWSSCRSRATSIALAADPRQPGVVFDTGTWTRFGGYYAYDPAAGERRSTRSCSRRAATTIPATSVSTEVKAKSHDGTLVPLSIVHRKGLKLDGTAPTILYGYGAYGISQTPFFRPQYLAWFERGGVLAVAHVRGGGENGEEWYKGGYQQTKPNTWRDAIACAEWLIANRLHVAARARDRGRQPGRHLRRAARSPSARISSARRSTRFRYPTPYASSFESNGELDKTEMGTTETEAGFRALYAMSPYHHIAGRREISGGARHDRHQRSARRRVAGREDGGSAAGGQHERQARAACASISTRATAYGSTKKQRNEELADTLAFLLWQFGVKGYVP